MDLHYFRYYLILNRELDTREYFKTVTEAKIKAKYYVEEIGMKNIHIVCLVGTVDSTGVIPPETQK